MTSGGADVQRRDGSGDHIAVGAVVDRDDEAGMVAPIEVFGS